ncbi:MAG: bifunctional 3-deoxy-7-phosphoheptulonate synthase/chorismate mutase [Candidatus Dormibacteria bacterium]
MPDADAPLPVLRAHLSEIDRQIVALIAERFHLVGDVGRRKQGTDTLIRDSERERAVLEAVEEAARAAGAPVNLVRRIYRDLLGESVSRQVSERAGGPAEPVRVAVQGGQNTPGALAAQKWLAASERQGEMVPVRTHARALELLREERADLAVVPIENTIAGSINEVYDLLRESQVSIVGEETWSIDHCLAGTADVPLSVVRTVVADLDALEQCSAFVQALSSAAPSLCGDSAEAMSDVASAADPTRVAIGTPEAAAAAGLHVLRRGIANHPENHTRYVVLARHALPVDVHAPCKTSLVFVSRHEQGALIRSLEVLASTGHSMTKLESRPRPGRPWEYMFFLDFEGNIADPRTAAALDELRATALHLTVLGSYPAKVAAPELRDGRITTSSDAPVDLFEAVSGPAPPRASSSYRLAGRAARADDSLIPVGDLLVGGSGFVVMAGPCSVESREQVMQTARAVRGAGAAVLRGGVFKPRTSPYAFQGLGWEGLEMLAAAGRATGMPVVSEVMAVEQVRRMAETVDILQVGARNMQNFDLLRELGRVDRPVLLKRGLSSTIEEWLGAAEYILSVGNQQVMLCERGIRTFETSTRNTLDLSAIPVLRERTHLPVIVDPSHGTGYRAYVAPMSRAARAAGAHGLLIEVHPDPDAALSDAAQSLSLPEFAALMRGLDGVTPP